MPRVRKITQIPLNLRDELDGRLRNSGYSGLVALSDWLKGLGYEVGKSAVHRYSVELRARDRAIAAGVRGMRSDISNYTTTDILAELGALRVREHRLVRRLEEVSAEWRTEGIR